MGYDETVKHRGASLSRVRKNWVKCLDECCQEDPNGFRTESGVFLHRPLNLNSMKFFVILHYIY